MATSNVTPSSAKNPPVNIRSCWLTSSLLIRTSVRRRLGRLATYSPLLSTRAVTRSMIFTSPVSSALALNNLQPLVDLLLVRAGAITPEHELDNVGGYRKLATEGSDQVFPDQIPVQ